jgi:putative colanic acid biosynthesis UDP-glucose lipid carrier transferase
MTAVGHALGRGPQAVDRAAQRPANSRRKRLLDLTLSAAALLVLLPLLLLVAVAIAIDTPGPVIFRQRRSGLNGRPFVIYKFRTMRVEEDGGDVRQAVAGDERVTAVGRLLRSLSIDEVPQLVNVLAGDMSLVGPRPHALAHDAQWRRLDPSYDARFSVRPGLTGLAQVQGCRGLVSTPDCLRRRLAADLAYIQDWTLTLDLAIILRTLPLITGDERAL